MAAGWEGDRQNVWDNSRRVGEWLVDAFERHAEGDGYHLPGMCLNVLAA